MVRHGVFDLHTSSPGLTSTTSPQYHGRNCVDCLPFPGTCSCPYSPPPSPPRPPVPPSPPPSPPPPPPPPPPPTPPPGPPPPPPRPRYGFKYFALIDLLTPSVCPHPLPPHSHHGAAALVTSSQSVPTTQTRNTWRAEAGIISIVQMRLSIIPAFQNMAYPLVRSTLRPQTAQTRWEGSQQAPDGTQFLHQPRVIVLYTECGPTFTVIQPAVLYQRGRLCLQQAA